MTSIPTHIFANVLVPDTPLITATLSYARAHSTEVVYNHVVRSWLFGCIIAKNIPDFEAYDVEVHAVSALLHDLGWDNAGGLVSADKRFEVDSAEAAKAFLLKETSNDPSWDKHRLQLVWDAIALHTTPGIALHKEVEVRITAAGVLTEFVGPEKLLEGAVSRPQWDIVLTQYPRLELADEVKEILCGFCRTKPQVTWDNFVGDFGERFVEGYDRAGKTLIDLIEATKK